MTADVDHVVSKLRSLRRRLDVSYGQLIQLFWQAHPRFQFFKTLPWDSRLLDIGAGSGGLAHWKDWCPPVRRDLTLYGIDLEIGEYRHLYEDWEAIDLDQMLPSFPGVALNAFYTSHLIEHLAVPQRLVQWIGERAAPESRIYVEWPNPGSVHLPTRGELLDRGIDVVISNFADDLTHRETPPLSTVCAWLRDIGFTVVSSGTVDTGMIGEELFTQAKNAGDRTMGYWSITGFSHYIVAVKLPPG